MGFLGKIVLLVGSCVIFTGQLQAGSSELSLMFYNVLNLFDAEHDEGKNDWAYLPKDFPGKAEQCRKISSRRWREECLNSDWTNASVELKINQLDEAIKSATQQKLPDILGLSEVENPNVVGKFATKLGYQSFVMTNSPDKRGIDLALLFNETADLKFIEKREHVIINEPHNSKPTRNILEVEFKLDGHRLIVMVHHWPSQGAPSAVRLNVAKQVQAITDRELERNPDTHIVMMGDFNVIPQDHPHPFHLVTMSYDSKNPFLDVHRLYKKSRPNNQTSKMMPYGTYFYMSGMTWNLLDRFFVSKNLRNNKNLEVDPKSYRILAPKKITKDFKYSNPAYFSHGTTIARVPYSANMNAVTADKAGYSDHFPIFVKLKY